MDAAEWSDQFTSANDVGLIPGSSGTVQTDVVGGVATVTITVRWSENEWDNDPDGDAATDDGSNVNAMKDLTVTVRL